MRPYSSVKVLCRSEDTLPVPQVLGYWGNLGKLGPNTSSHAQGHMKSNPSN